MGWLARWNFNYLIDKGYNHFIETGTGTGNAVDFACKCGIQRIDSCEQSNELYKTASARFQQQKNFGVLKSEVHLYNCKSTHFLEKFNDYDKAIVFLDAHLTGGADFSIGSFDEAVKHPDSFPLFEELKILLKKDLKDTVIIIDDARMYFDDITTAPRLNPNLRFWDKRQELLHICKEFLNHTTQLVDMDHGYLILLPHPMTYTVSINIQ